MIVKRVAWASAVGTVAAGIVFVSLSASKPSIGPSAAPALQRATAASLKASWSAQRAYDYMGRRPDKTYINLGLPCAAWYGGWVKDWDPYFKKYGGKRATWTVELCWRPT